MGTGRLCGLALVVASLTVQASPAPVPQAGKGVREPAVAGQFYPATGARLNAALTALLEDAVPPRPERPIALLVPHAGYIYSGQIAADGFRQAAQHRYDTVVIIGTSHSGLDLGRIAIDPGAAFRTPLGTVPIDEDLRARLLKEDADCVADAAPHASEHSVEVQVPFVQRLFPAARIVPIVIGSADAGLCTRFGRALARVAGDRQVLVVASSDLSHYPSAANAIRVDRRILEAVAALDAPRLQLAVGEEMKRAVPELVTCACGEGAIVATIAAAVALGATRGAVISYANSGDVSIGDPSTVVGYGAVVMTAGAPGSDTAALNRPAAADASVPLQPRDKDALLGLARDTIRRYLTTDTVPLDRADNPRLLRSNGVFVTLRKRGVLRGCIGQIAPAAPLVRLTGLMALEAAFNDPRFDKLRADELNDIEIEISLLTPLRPVASAEAIQVGRDGVLLTKNGQSAVFLPSVATEEGWNRDQLLDNLCVKAGLPPGSWRVGAQLSVFQADAFSEKGATPERPRSPIRPAPGP
jgi:MEMO1 family protein